MMAIKIHNTIEDYNSFKEFVVEIRNDKRVFNSLIEANKFFRENCVEDSYLYAVSDSSKRELAKCSLKDGLRFTPSLYTFITCEYISKGE